MAGKNSTKRPRGKEEAGPLPLAARTATANSPDQVNGNGRGVKVFICVTAAGTGSVTPKIQGKDPVSGQYYDILAGTALTSNGLAVLTVYPGLAAAANSAAND